MWGPENCDVYDRFSLQILSFLLLRPEVVGNVIMQLSLYIALKVSTEFLSKNVTLVTEPVDSHFKES